MADQDILLWQGEVNPKNIKLRPAAPYMPLPFDWPLSERPRQPAREFIAPLNLALNTVTSAPFNQELWDSAVRALPKVAGEAVGTLNPLLTPNPKTPFNQYEWRNTARTPLSLKSDVYFGAFSLYSPNPPAPFNQKLWDNATKSFPKAIGEAVAGVAPLLSPNPAQPFAQTDWFQIRSTQKAKVDDFVNLASLNVLVIGLSAALTQEDAALSATFAVLVSASASLTQSDALTASESEIVGLSAALTQDDFSLSADVSVISARRGVGRPSGEGRRVRIQPRKAWDRTLTPENWDEIQALLRAEQAALDKADSLDNAKAKAALERATDAASDAIEALERQSFEAGQAARLTRELQAAAAAESVKATLRHARLVNEYAIALMAHMAEMEDEDEAIVLLMM